MHRLKGCGVATITPFRNGKVDQIALASVVDFQIREGIDYIVCLGTTGESTTLEEKEQRQIIEITLEVNGGRVPVVLGNFGGNNTQEILDRFTRFNFDGIDAVLSVSPYYSKPTQEGIYQHYTALAKKSPLPIIMYNVPGRTASNITANTVIRLANDHRKICGVKDASADLVQATKIARSVPEDFLLLSGDDPTALPLMACGGSGVISVIANAYPGAFTRMIRYALEGTYAEATPIHQRFIDLHHWLYLEGNPVGIKGCMDIMGLCTPEVRLPLVSVTDQTRSHMMAEMEKIKSIERA